MYSNTPIDPRPHPLPAVSSSASGNGSGGGHALAFRASLDPLDGAAHPPLPKPKTWTVLGLLALTALTFSYLGSYALYNALVAAEVMPHFRGPDPRPRWLLTGFCILMLLFMALGECCRRLSRSELKAIDEMASADEQ